AAGPQPARSLRCRMSRSRVRQNAGIAYPAFWRTRLQLRRGCSSDGLDLRPLRGLCRRAEAAQEVQAAAQAPLDIHARLVAEFGLRPRDVGLAVADVAGTRVAVARQDIAAEQLVHQGDQLQQRGAPAAGDVVDLSADTRRLGSEEVGLDRILDEGE